MFGDNASLDVSGSFLAATAESLIFDNNEFSAVNPDAPPLLTVNFTPSLQYGGNGSEIDNQAVLEVGNEQNLSLLEDKVSHSASLFAPGGNIEVSGTDVTFTGTVDTRSPDGSVRNFQISDRDNILIQEEAISGEAISQALVNSNVALQANNDITVNDDITSRTDNNLTFAAGRSLSISEDRTISLSGGSFTTKFNDDALAGNRDTAIANFTKNPASAFITNGGDVSIEAGSFGDASQINMATDSAIITGNPEGDGGDINLTASGDITTGLLVSGFINNPGDEELPEFLDNFSSISTTAGDNTSGDGGDLTINTSESVEVIGDRPGVFVPNSPEDLLVLEGALISTSTQELGTSGDLTINTPPFLLLVREEI